MQSMNSGTWFVLPKQAKIFENNKYACFKADYFLFIGKLYFKIKYKREPEEGETVKRGEMHIYGLTIYV